ncbi:MAG TPA: amine oxidase [Rhodospirillaceae bacterium]|nr:amine oxidase [Rhodospirillaceae bacterium]
MPTTHIVGAGMAGLAAAVKLTAAGRKVVLYDSATHAGGRCRSFHDSTLDRIIDNGNHLLLSGNKAVFQYLNTIGTADSLVGPEEPAFHFCDVRSGERWCVRPNLGLFPWWVFRRNRRVPGSSWLDYFSALRLRHANQETTVTEILDPNGPLYEKYWQPLAVSVLNTPAEKAAACLLWPVVQETFGRGGRASRPMIAKSGLSDSFVEPALAYLKKNNADIAFTARLRDVELSADQSIVTGLNFADRKLTLEESDNVILALPAPVTGDVLEGISPPVEHNPIVNVHFRLETEIQSKSDINFLGVIGGTAEWLFLRGDIVSVTVSAAEKLAEKSAAEIIDLTWGDIALALDLGDSTPPKARVVKEKRATYAQTPESLKYRAKTDTATNNLKLAGDWTDTGVPATIEGAIRSGNAAARAVLRDTRA